MTWVVEASSISARHCESHKLTGLARQSGIASYLNGIGNVLLAAECETDGIPALFERSMISKDYQ